jgi:CheY-specific phosphatase CheX
MPEQAAGMALAEAVGNVLETMFFCSVLGEAGPAGEWPQPATRLRVAFRGTPSGDLDLAVSAEAAGAIASNFLGLEEGTAPEPEQITDSLRELANMICGAALSRLESDHIFEILPPELEPGDANSGAPAAACAYELDSGLVEATLRFEQVP